MTFVGKIFTVLVFIFSISFMVMAAMVIAMHKPYYDVVNLPPDQVKGGKKLGLVYQIEDLKEQKAALENEKEALENQLNAERVSRVIALGQLETELNRLNGELASKKVVLAETQKENAAANTTMNGSQKLAESLGKEVADLRGVLRDTQNDRDKVFNQFVAQTDKVHELTLLDTRLKQTNARLVSQYAKAKRVLDTLGVTVDMKVDGAAPSVNAIVTGVRKSSPQEIYVGLSVGSDDGILKGHEFNVTRGSSFVGKVKVVRVWPDRCVAISIPDYYKHPFEKNDLAKTITLGELLIGQAGR